MSELMGKVAIVTGASAGIGRAAAFALAAEGAKVVVADVDVARGEQVASDISDKGGTAMFVDTDVTDDASVAALVSKPWRALVVWTSRSTTRASRGLRRRPPTARRRIGNGRWRST